MSKKITNVLLILVAAVVFMFPLKAYVYAIDNTNSDYLKSVVVYVEENYSGDTEQIQLYEGALRGIFNSLDNYSTYYSNDEINSVLSNIEGSYCGIGISMEKKDDYVVIIQVFKESPADNAGLLQSDKIVLVDGTEVAGITVSEVSALIQGPPGTKVSLSVERTGARELLEFEVERGEIKINPIYYRIKEDIGYISIENFNSHTKHYFDFAMGYMDEHSIKKIILDLRGNPGGEVSQAVAVARHFIPKGVITTLDFKSENKDDIVYRSTLKEAKYELVVLVNGASASASEILAGAVQDSKAGVLVGSNTFGKAQVQSIFPMLTPAAYAKYERLLGAKIINASELISSHGIVPYESEIIGWSKITTGVYLTPAGKIIDANGLLPDVYAEDPLPVNGIYVNYLEKLSQTVEYTLNNSGIDVYNAEKLLWLLEYEIAFPDTLLDLETCKALHRFQRQNGLFGTGVLDMQTQNAMNKLIDSLVSENDLQYLRAVELLQN